MDQASLLRKLMIEKEQEKLSPISFVTTNDVENIGIFLVNLIRHCSEELNKKIILLGVETKKEQSVKKILKENEDLTAHKIVISNGATVIPGSLDILKGIKEDRELSKKLIKNIKKIEEGQDIIFYLAGKGLNSNVVNLSLLSGKIVLVAKPTTKSFVEIVNYVKILSKVSDVNKLNVIIDTDDPIIFKEQMKKLQELCWKEYKYYIEPIGFMKIKGGSLLEKEMFEMFNFNFVHEKGNNKQLSKRLIEIML